MDIKEQELLRQQFLAECRKFYASYLQYQRSKILCEMQEAILKMSVSADILLSNYENISLLLKKDDIPHGLTNSLAICRNLPSDKKMLKTFKVVKKPSRTSINKLIYKFAEEEVLLQITEQSIAAEHVLSNFYGRDLFPECDILDISHCKLSTDFIDAYIRKDAKKMQLIAVNTCRIS